MTADLEILREAARQMRDDADTRWHAIADWLDAEADHHEQLFMATAAALTAAGWELRTYATTLPQALAVARTYLGVQS